MTHLKAPIRTTTGKTLHLRVADSTRTAKITAFSQPVRVEIVAQGSAYLLLRFDDKSECVGDTWHETIDAAKAQAKFEFLIKDEDWELIA
jgi:hypothetical protein